MIALTGATGHLGYVIHRYLLKDNIEHKVLLRKQTNRINNVAKIYGDLSDDKALKQLVENTETVIHSAGIIYPKYGENKQVYYINFECSKRLFQYSKEAGVKHFIFISSIHSMEVPDGNIFDEKAPLVTDQNKSYDFSKAEMERFLAEQEGIKITILNPTSIIGGGDFYFNGFNQLFQLLEKNRVPMLTSGGYDVIDVKDVAKSCIFAAQYQIEGKFILGNTYFKIQDIAKFYGNVAKKLITPLKLSTQAMKMLATFTDFVDGFSKKPLPTNSYSINTLLELKNSISHQKAVDKLNFKPKVIHNSLQDIHKWILNEEFIAD